MNRVLKQVIYGVFYIIILFFIAKGVYGLFFVQAPSCSDGILNQGEEGVDCGGPCQSCDLANLEPLEISSDVVNFSFDSLNSILVRVSNPNPNYNADYQYKVSFLNGSGDVVDESYGSSYGVVLSDDYITESSSRNFNDVRIEIIDTEWINSLDSVSGKPKVDDFSVNLDDDVVLVEGTVVNEESLGFDEVKIISLFKDEFGFNTLAFSQSVLNSIDALDSRNFSVRLELSDDLKKSIVLENTEIFVSVNR